MKTKIVLMMATLISVIAQADIGHKAPLKADFRSLIDNTYQERKEVANGLNETTKHKPSPSQKSLSEFDKKRVTDFVDAELGWGKAPEMVDRRFDSVSEPVIFDPHSF